MASCARDWEKRVTLAGTCAGNTKDVSLSPWRYMYLKENRTRGINDQRCCPKEEQDEYELARVVRLTDAALLQLRQNMDVKVHVGRLLGLDHARVLHRLVARERG
jgi:hypothetical protein